MSEFTDYIAAKTGAAPAATGESEFATYLRAKGLTPASSEPAKHADVPAPPSIEEPGFFGRALNTIQQGAHAVKTVGSELATHPIDTLADPSKRHQFERGMGDVLTAGLANKVAGAIGDAAGDAGEANLRATEAEDNARNPEYRTAGNIAGFVAPNPFGKLGAATAERALGGLAAKTSGKLAGAGLGAAKGLVSYEASAVPLAAARAAGEGESPWAAATRAATDPMGLALSAGGGAVGGAARGEANHMRDPSTPQGRDLAAIAAVGGKVNAIGEPVTHGAFETPELKESGPGLPGQQKLAAESVGRTVARNEAALHGAVDAWDAKANAILADHHPDEIYRADATHAAVDALDKSNTHNGVVGSDRVAAATDKVRRMLTSQTGEVDRAASMQAGKVVYKAEPGGSVADLMGVRKLVNSMWKHTQEPAEKYVYGQALKSLAEDAAKVDPRIGELNAEYRATMQQLTETNDALFGQQKPRAKITEGTKQTAAQRMARVGQDDRPGLAADPRMEKFANASPENAHEVALMRAKNAAERLRYGAPQLSTNLERGLERAVEHGAAKGVGAVVGGALGGVPGAIVGHGAGALVRSLPQAKVRIGLPAADVAAHRINGSSGKAAVVLAREEQRRRDATRAAAVGGR